MNVKRQLLVTLVLALFINIYAQRETENYYAFTDTTQNNTLTLLNYSGRFKPTISENGYLQLTQGGYAVNHCNAVLFPDTLSSDAEVEHFYFHLYITRGAKGAGFALLQSTYLDYLSAFTPPIPPLTDDGSIVTDWSSPSFPRSFGIGIDIYNPQTSHWFDKYGNFYGREEREISLHWDGKEVYKILSPVEFRSDQMETDVYRWDVYIQYAIGGAFVSVAIDSTKVIDSYFIPEMEQYEKLPVFGAKTGDLTTTVILDDFGYKTTGTVKGYAMRSIHKLLSDEVFHAERREAEGSIDFPDYAIYADRVIMTLDLGGAAGGVSAWDVSGYIYIIDEDSTRFELLRFITPYNRAYIWKVDVTDFLPLFTGTKGVYATVHTWEGVTEDPAQQKGWKVNARLDFYIHSLSFDDKGLTTPSIFSETGHKPFQIQNLWCGSFEYGDIDNPMKNMLPDYTIPIPQEAKSAKLRIVTTGHGMSPNTDNAAEFRPSDRWIVVNGDEYHNLLWKTDNYLNPCRPQDGTWKFDRAGWAPGDIVRAWEIDLTKYIYDSTLIISYIPDDYININRGETWEPFHSIAAQVIFYK